MLAGAARPVKFTLLVAGDLVVLAGVDHAWRAGPDGARLSAVLIGTPPPGNEP